MCDERNNSEYRHGDNTIFTGKCTSDVVFVIDVSESVNDDEFQHMQDLISESIRTWFEDYQRAFRVAGIAFSSTVYDQNTIQLTDEYTTFLDWLYNDIFRGGWTSHESGLQHVIDFIEFDNPEAEKIVVFITDAEYDGNINTLNQIAEEYKTQDIITNIITYNDIPDFDMFLPEKGIRFDFEEPLLGQLLAQSIHTYVRCSEDILTIFVNNENSDGPWYGTEQHPFQYIQHGFYVASPQDEIFVFSGSYHENILISRECRLNGENRETTIVDADGKKFAIKVLANDVSISNFTLQNAGAGSSAGAYIVGNSCIIAQSIIKNNINYGLLAEGSDQLIITHNLFTESNRPLYLEDVHNTTIETNGFNHSDSGVILYNSKNISICQNEFQFIESYSIKIDEHSDHTYVRDNEVSFGESHGIYLDDSQRCELVHNHIFNNHGVGMYISSGSHHTIISGNRILANQDYGIELRGNADNVLISGNTLSENKNRGVSVESSNNHIVHNNITNTQNHADGLILTQSSENNLIYHNSFSNNNPNAVDYGSNNQWYYNGHGNYWDDYQGSDTNGDNIGEAPYSIDFDNYDFFPLMIRPPVGDCNKDFIVDQSDLGIILAQFEIGVNEPIYLLPGDLDFDGDVDQSDLGILLAHYQ